MPDIAVERLKFDTLLPNPSVTVCIDGLIVVSHGESGKVANLTQAAIHTQAEHHALLINVFDKDGVLQSWNPGVVWDGSHEQVKKIEPLWLFVDHDGNEPPPPAEYSSNLAAATTGEKSFDHVLDFERDIYHHRLEGFRLDRVARLNMPHGLFYSADHEVSEVVEEGETPGSEVSHTGKDSSTLGGCDIDIRSTLGVKRNIVLWQTNPLKQLFSFPLDATANYQIQVLNIPIHPGDPTPPEEHFLQYYGLFTRRLGEHRFFVRPKPHSEKARRARLVPTPPSPPCDITQMSESDPIV
jgi:hypothetical protein